MTTKLHKLSKALRLEMADWFGKRTKISDPDSPISIAQGELGSLLVQAPLEPPDLSITWSVKSFTVHENMNSELDTLWHHPLLFMF